MQQCPASSVPGPMASKIKRKAPPRRGRKSRIDDLPPAIRDRLNELLRTGVSQKRILAQLTPLCTAAGEQPISRSGLSRYATKMEQFGRRVRETREIAKVWTDKFGEQPAGNITPHLIEVLRTLVFEITLTADDTDDAGQPVLSPAMINDLALAIQRLERAAEIGVERERKLRVEFAKEAEGEAKKAGISSTTALAIRRALEAQDA